MSAENNGSTNPPRKNIASVKMPVGLSKKSIATAAMPAGAPKKKIQSK